MTRFFSQHWKRKKENAWEASKRANNLPPIYRFPIDKIWPSKANQDRAVGYWSYHGHIFVVSRRSYCRQINKNVSTKEEHPAHKTEQFCLESRPFDLCVHLNVQSCGGLRLELIWNVLENFKLQLVDPTGSCTRPRKITWQSRSPLVSLFVCGKGIHVGVLSTLQLMIGDICVVRWCDLSIGINFYAFVQQVFAIFTRRWNVDKWIFRFSVFKTWQVWPCLRRPSLTRDQLSMNEFLFCWLFSGLQSTWCLLQLWKKLICLHFVRLLECFHVCLFGLSQIFLPILALFNDF